MPRLLIVDGHAYAYRAFYAIRELRAPGGQPTNAIFGFIKMAAKLRSGELAFAGAGLARPTHFVVIWDGGLAAERVAALPEYKAHRPAMPEALARQLDEIVAWLDASRIASWCRDGVEADDWIAALARRAEGEGWSVVIASSDKDFMQLVTGDTGPVTGDTTRAGGSCHSSPATCHPGRIGLVNPGDKTETVWTAEQVRAKTGVGPAQIVDWLSLVGDSVDNIPGVPGVGPKTAAELLNQFGSVTALYARLAEVKSGRLRSALQNAAGDVRRNQELVRLRSELPGGFAPDELAVKPADVDALCELYTRWGFRSLRAELEAATAQQGALF